MKLNLKDKIMLVTGSTHGIGFSIAQYLLTYGCKVIINGRNEDRLKIATAKLPGATGLLGDVSDPKTASDLLKSVKSSFSQLDGLVCNVGSGTSVEPGYENFEEWQRVFSKNLWSTTNMVEGASDLLEKSSGAIVCISSICGQKTISNAPVTYSVAKSALNTYVERISIPLGRKGIRINAIAPGNILFKGSVWDKKLKENKFAVENMLKNNVALRKLGAPEDIANLTAYLLSQTSKFVTGSIYNADGGQF